MVDDILPRVDSDPVPLNNLVANKKSFVHTNKRMDSAKNFVPIAEEKPQDAMPSPVAEESINATPVLAPRTEEEPRVDVSNTRYRSYFEFVKENPLVKQERTLTAFQRAKVPIVLTSKIKYLKWTVPVPVPRARKSHYDVVLGISTKNLNLDAIEAIVITTDEEVRGLDTFRSEVITQEELRRLCSTELEQRTNNNGTVDGERAQVAESTQASNPTRTASAASCFLWKLHERYILFDRSLPLVMEVRTWENAPADYGSIKLHYAEVHTDSQAYYKDDPMYREHMPHLVSVDTNRTGCPQLDVQLDQTKTIDGFCFSRHGSHVLVCTVAGQQRFLQLWQLKTLLEPSQVEPSRFNSPPRFNTELLRSHLSGPLTQSNQSRHSVEPPKEPEPFQPRLVAWMQLPETTQWSVDLLLSCDGSQFAIIDLVPLEMSDDARKNYNSITAFYICDVNHTDPPEGAVAGSGFVRNHIEQKYHKLRGYSGKAQFHIVDTKSQDVTDELFVTCDGATIEVYGVYPNWKHLRSILLNQAPNVLNQAPKGFDFAASANQALLHLLRGRFLVIKDPDATCVSTWDIEQGSRISSFTHLTTNQISAVSKISTMSTDGRLIAIPGQRHIDVFLTATWTRVDTYVFQDIEPTDRIGNVRFIRNDTQIIVSTASEGFRFYRNNRGFILNIETMSVVERYISEGSSSFWLATDHSTSPEVLYFRDSQISLFNLEDRTVQSPFKLRERCDRFCTSLASPEAQSTTETTSPSGLVFNNGLSTTSVVINGRRENLYFVTVTISAKNGPPLRRMSIPLPKAMKLSSVTFESNSSHMVIAFNNMVMVWSIPKSPQGELRLQLVHTGDSDVIWKLCPHGQLYGIRTGHNNTIVEVYLDDPLRNSQSQFLGGIRYLVEVFESAGDVMKQDIIQYVGKYINCYLLDDHFGGDVMVHNNPWNNIMLDNNPGDNIRPDDTLSGNIRLDTLSDNIVPYICSNWSPEMHESILLFMKTLLTHPSVRWIPKHMKDLSNNPIHILLEKAEGYPKAFDVAEILIDHCIDQAELDKDPYLLLPIRQCLHYLTDPDKPYADITLKVFRSLAYFPARGRDFIMSHHSIAHPYDLRLQFWGPKLGLDQLRDQVLHLTVEPVGPAANRPMSKFNRDLYLATFDMIWRKTGAKESNPYEPETDSETKGIFSWPYAFVHMILRKCRLIQKATVECHDFEITFLDNPAIEALVEYKWNTIGFYFWLMRFLSQFVFYILVLTGVFMQIYRGDEGKDISGVFIAIVVTSAFFLWLEFIQMLKDSQGYILSIYNTVDLFTFTLPLIGSLRELFWATADGHNSWLSFSVLFIFLHCLFELRVIRFICHFVSMITHAIASIRVFIFVFMGGILAFAIAILHMLHACTNAEDCPAYTEGFSLNMLRGLSMTYFMMGGRYDPLSNGFDTDNVSFHLMMAVFFFFTVILMLNVLIALVNEAINDGDKTWELHWLNNRLRYIESAENLTYDIPGYRAARNFFPETIYYTAAAPQVRIYKKESQRILDESAVIPATQANEVQDRRPDFDDSLGSGALVEFMKNYQEKQSRRDEEQKSREQERSRRLEEEKQRLEDAQLRRDEEHKQVVADLRDEVRALKSQLQH